MSQTSIETSRNPRRHWGTRILFGLLALVGGAAVVLVATLLFGLNTGEEFSPNAFSRRVFYYYEIPLLRIQVTPIVRDDQTNGFERYLRRQGLVKTGNQGETRWDLVQAARSGKTTFHGDADILCSYLDAVDAEGDRYWQTWSEENPKLAGILWPLVARMAERQLYIFVPELIDLASSVSQPDELQRKLNDSLGKQYWRLAKIQQEQGDHETAVELLTRSLEYVPGDQAVLECRKRSLQVLEQRSTAQPK